MFGVQQLASELRTAVRAVARRPATSLVLIITIGLGIGATTSIFTVVDAVLLRPRPFRDPNSLANVWTLENRTKMPKPSPNRLAAKRFITNEVDRKAHCIEQPPTV